MYSILDIIPQRAPIVMVDKFLGMNDKISQTSFTVKDDCIFVENGVLSECGLIEHIAQSAAARVGYICKVNNQPVPIGYIGAVNDFIIVNHPRKDDVITTHIEILQEIFTITLIQARCYVGETEIATCKMKIFLESDEAKS